MVRIKFLSSQFFIFWRMFAKRLKTNNLVAEILSQEFSRISESKVARSSLEFREVRSGTRLAPQIEI